MDRLPSPRGAVGNENRQCRGHDVEDADDGFLGHRPRWLVRARAKMPTPAAQGGVTL